MSREQRGARKSRVAMILVVCAIGIAALANWAGDRSEVYEPREGDLVFHESKSSQSRLIQIATKSRYSHVGIVHLANGEPFVLEAITTVQSTPLDEWIARGEEGHFVAMRLRSDAVPSDGIGVELVRQAATQFLGLEYDWWFQWSNERMYCSELVWKILHSGLGIEVGTRQRFDAFEIHDPSVAAEIEKRFGDAPAFDEPIVSPVSMLESELLVEVYRD